jgi:hypothetical protein
LNRIFQIFLPKSYKSVCTRVALQVLSSV